jgi:hypothetical protein
VISVIDNGVQVAFSFFGLGLLFIFTAAVLFGLVDFIRRLLG